MARPHPRPPHDVRMSTQSSYATERAGRPGSAPPMTGWIGVVVFGGIMLFILGLFHLFEGIVALNQVDLVVPRSAIIGLIGPNGAGKTTFFNVVTGLMRPDAGSITFEGASLVGLRPNAIVARGIARTFQSIRLFPLMTVLENVLVGEHCRLGATVPKAFVPLRGRGHPVVEPALLHLDHPVAALAEQVMVVLVAAQAVALLGAVVR